MSIEYYLKQTEPAVRHLFNGLLEYDVVVPPALVNYIDETGQIVMTKEENDAFLNAHKASFALETARASLAGSILQIAYSGIKVYSPNKTISKRCKELGVTMKCKSALPFCLGKEVKGIPEGLIIYTGRIQYNHWEEGMPNNSVAKKVFRELAQSYYDNPHFDLVYELNYPNNLPVSHYIIRLELGWHNYEDYLVTIRSLLTNGCHDS